MTANTITTKARVRRRGRTTRTILALSLAVALFAATASSASTTPTPAAPELTLGVRASAPSFPQQKLRFYATTSNDSTLVARGSKIEKTTNQLAAGEETKIAVRVKHKKQLARGDAKGRATVKIKFAATDEFGQTATGESKLRILVHGGGGVLVLEDQS